jgi:hypothetical protein
MKTEIEKKSKRAAKESKKHTHTDTPREINKVRISNKF